MRTSRTVWIAGLLTLVLVGGYTGYRGFLLDRSGSRRSTGAVVDPGTLSMVRRLKAIAGDVDARDNPFANRARAALYRDQLGAELTRPVRFDLSVRLGLELLRSGQTEAAIEVFQATRTLPGSAAEPDVEEWLLRRLLGLAHLRLGEQENCLDRHGCDSCLLPIRASGVHAVDRGSRGAIEHLAAALAVRPRDLSTVWLLNIAYMTLGEYPDRVPSRWRIPATSFRSEGEARRFRDVAPDVGLDVVGLSGGAAMEDFDGDGLLDIVCSSWRTLDQMRFFRNEGNGGFSDQTERAGLVGIGGGLNLLHADYDNDGNCDVLVLRGAWLSRQGDHPNSLLRNRGDGTFADVTEAAGLLTLHPTQTAAWGDYNGDGWLDLFIGNESDEEATHPCELFHNRGDGTFVERAGDVGLDHVGFVKGVVWGDYDGDGDPDLYLSCLGETNRLFRNDGPKTGARAASKSSERASASPFRSWRFTDVTEQAGVSEPLLSFPVWFWDYDNDGWLDLFVLSYGWERTAESVAADYLGRRTGPMRPRLYRNRGDGAFDDVTRSAGVDHVLIAMGAGYGDIDGDGFLDAYVGTGEPSLDALMPNRLFRNDRGRRFEDVTTAAGLGHLQKGHAVAFGDIDGDGDEDIYTVLGGAYEGDVYPNALFRNPGHGTHWITIRLEGTRSNRSAIGAQVRITIDDGRGDEIDLHRTVTTGGSFGSSSLQLEVGLGSATSIISLLVTWPTSGLEHEFMDVPVDRVIALRESDREYRVLPGRRFQLGSPGAPGE